MGLSPTEPTLDQIERLHRGFPEVAPELIECETDAWDARIDRWLTHDIRSVNRGHGGYEDWRDEEFERAAPIRDVSVGEILEGALGIEPAKWTKGDQMRVGAWLKSRDWERYRNRNGAAREWRYRRPDGNG
ncbi:hypothetical protein [Aquibium sp. ELW1220]|uniref:hypothetical protein n=1 Tax=Aquibium sp. ELW1220 TaxID=2976766 RepID=UPI0025AFBDFA|nr:hypothetical protein [Aquibium sp. ELW1220]MDN2579005.1 hypothetical protein [Aquibium sp. ELW1220]